MILYVTTGESRDREVHPLHTIPDTVTELFQLGMREHARTAVLQTFDGVRWSQVPAWRIDRRVIRLALFLKERLDVSGDEPVGIVGPLDPLWPTADFAIQGLGSRPVGFSHTLSDAQLVDAGPRWGGQGKRTRCARHVSWRRALRF